MDKCEEEADLQKQNFIQDNHVERREDVSADEHDYRIIRKLGCTRHKTDQEGA